MILVILVIQRYVFLSVCENVYRQKSRANKST